MYARKIKTSQQEGLNILLFQPGQRSEISTNHVMSFARQPMPELHVPTSAFSPNSGQDQRPVYAQDLFEG
jgi:hypothetical protein